MQINRMYADVPEAWPIRRSRETVDPSRNLEQEAQLLQTTAKLDELRRIANAAERATEILEEKPRKRQP